MRLIVLVASCVLLTSGAHAVETDIVWGDRAANVVVSSDGLTVTGTTGGFGSARASVGRSTGKRAFEIEIVSSAGSSRYGVGDGQFALSSYLGTSANALGVWSLTLSPIAGAFSKLGTDSAPALAAGIRYQILIDFAAKKGWVRRNGSYRTASADPAAGSGADFSFTGASALFPAVSSYNPGDAMRLRTKVAEMAAVLPAGFISWAEEDGTPPPPPPPPSGQAGIGLLGDSITWYMDQAPNASATLLGFMPTFNFGAPSSTTTGMLSRLSSLIALKPKAVFILGGVNDYPLGVSRDDTVSNIVAMVNACLDAGIIPFVETILPVAPGYPLYGGGAAMNAEIAARNALIHQALLPIKGGQWVDWGGRLATGDWISDGIHLSAPGFAKMASAIAPYVDLYR